VPAASSDEVLNDALMLMRHGNKEQSAKYWVNYLSAHMKRLRPRLFAQLVAKGLMTVNDERILGLFHHRTHRLTDAHTALCLKDQLRQVLFQPFAPTRRQVAIIGLIKPSGLNLFTREERGAARARIDEILKNDPISKAVSQAIVEAGATAAIIAASAAAGA